MAGQTRQRTIPKVKDPCLTPPRTSGGTWTPSSKVCPHLLPLPLAALSPEIPYIHTGRGHQGVSGKEEGKGAAVAEEM